MHHLTLFCFSLPTLDIGSDSLLDALMEYSIPSATWDLYPNIVLLTR